MKFSRYQIKMNFLISINKIFIDNNQNDDRIEFYELIEIEDLSNDKLNEFISNIKADDMTSLLWEKVRK